LCFLAMCAVGAPQLTAQVIQGGISEGIDLPADSLLLKEEWWLGVNISAHYAMGFGTMSAQYIGGTTNGSPPVYAQTEGGFGYGIAFAPSIEYRAYRSPLGIMMNVGVDYRHNSSTSTIPISNGIYAYNATFETNSAVLYGTLSLFAKFSLGARGFFVLGGPFLDLPLSSNTYIWQHETIPDGQVAGEVPGFGNTNIRFESKPALRPRIGLQIGFGTDLLVGLFGYTHQLLTPYFTIQGATPVVSEPTTWNSLMVRGGVMWRVGL